MSIQITEFMLPQIKHNKSENGNINLYEDENTYKFICIVYNTNNN